MLVTNIGKIKIESEQKLTLDEFLKVVTSDEGLDLDGSKLYMDVVGFDQDTFVAIYEAVGDELIVFTSNEDGSIPDYLEGSDIPTWESLAQELGVPAYHEEPKEEFVRKEKKPVSYSRSGNSDGIVDDGNENEDYHDEDQDVSPEDKYKEKEVLHILDEESTVSGSQEEGQKDATIYAFGSSKGGTGKTFTCLIAAYRYAKTHPGKSVAVADFDIIDGQVGISIHKPSPTMRAFYKRWQLGAGYRDFKTMRESSVKNDNFPSNIDFYLAPKESSDPINSEQFWDTIFYNLITNYDAVFFDTGIDYLNIKPITNVYKLADRIILTSTTSIKSVSSVGKQISRLRGEMDTNGIFSKDDELAEKIGLILTRTRNNNSATKMAIKSFEQRNTNIIAAFGVLDESIEEAEYFGRWNVFDKHTKFNENIDKVFVDED